MPLVLAIEAAGVTKVYKGRARKHSLKYPSRSRQQGFTCSAGRGKTTFVRICATQLMPTSGSISVWP